MGRGWTHPRERLVHEWDERARTCVRAVDLVPLPDVRSGGGSTVCLRCRCDDRAGQRGCGTSTSQHTHAEKKNSRWPHSMTLRARGMEGSVCRPRSPSPSLPRGAIQVVSSTDDGMSTNVSWLP